MDDCLGDKLCTERLLAAVMWIPEWRENNPRAGINISAGCYGNFDQYFQTFFRDIFTIYSADCASAMSILEAPDIPENQGQLDIITGPFRPPINPSDCSCDADLGSCCRKY